MVSSFFQFYETICCPNLKIKTPTGILMLMLNIELSWIYCPNKRNNFLLRDIFYMYKIIKKMCVCVCACNRRNFPDFVGIYQSDPSKQLTGYVFVHYKSMKIKVSPFPFPFCLLWWRIFNLIWSNVTTAAQSFTTLTTSVALLLPNK